MRKTKTISICLEPDLHDWIRRFAFENHTSVSATIQQLIKAAQLSEEAKQHVNEETQSE